MPLPYENATTGEKALTEMKAILKGFGASSFGSMVDFDTGELVVQFQWRERRVTLKASSRGYAAAWLRHHPWSTRMRTSRAEYERRALEQAQISVYSILRDWIKGQVTAIEVGMLSFEGAFLSSLVLNDGRTVMERIEESGMLKIASE